MSTNKHGHYSDPSRYTAPEQSEPEEHLTAEYVNSLEPIKQRKAKAKRNRIIFLTVLAVVGVAAAIYFLVFKPEPKTPPAQPTQQTQTEEEPAADAPTEPYSSSAFGLSFDYPNTWQPEDTESALLVRSPTGTFTDSSGTKVRGRVVVSFNQGGGKVPGFDAGNPVAVIESQKLTYAKPSQNQRKQTYLSFADFTGSNGIESIFVTGDAGYTKDQIIPQTDVKKVDPIIRIAFEQCEGETCGGEGQGALSVATSEWQKNPLLVQAEKLLESLRVQ